MDTRAELNFKSLIEHDKTAQKIIELLISKANSRPLTDEDRVEANE